MYGWPSRVITSGFATLDPVIISSATTLCVCVVSPGFSGSGTSTGACNSYPPNHLFRIGTLSTVRRVRRTFPCSGSI